MCGCGGKKSNNRKVFNNRLVRSTPNNSFVPNGATPEQLRILNVQNNTEPKSSNLDSDKRRIEKLRRDAVRKALNK